MNGTNLAAGKDEFWMRFEINIIKICFLSRSSYINIETASLIVTKAKNRPRTISFLFTKKKTKKQRIQVGAFVSEPRGHKLISHNTPLLFRELEKNQPNQLTLIKYFK